jgi:uncharacterized protein (TIGR00661 family)
MSSEGMGHATRALPTILGLRARGYRVEVFCGGRVAAFLRTRLGPVHEIFYVPLVYEGTRLNMGKSTWQAVVRLPECLRSAWGLFWRMMRERPVAVISDFEFLSAWLGWWSATPVIVLDNMHLITLGQLPPTEPGEETSSAKGAARAIFWNQLVYARALITSFYQPGLKPGVSPTKVRFVPCAVRAEVQALRDVTRTDGPVLVYQTSGTNQALPATLSEAAAKTGLQFAVYGMGQPGDVPGVSFRAFSEQGFLQDMAHAPFVIVNGGHSTIVEALALQKPVLAEPIHAHYEQRSNAIGLEKLGVGVGVRMVSVDAIVDFQQQLPRMRANTASIQAILNTSGLVDEVCKAISEVAPQRALSP